jgi:chemosensory pili system protein ChpA (sensor histidine kinase/response regulator)
MYPAMLSQDLLFDWHGHAEKLMSEVAALESSQPELATYLLAMGDFILRHIADKQVLTYLEPSLSHAFDALNLIAADQSPRIDKAQFERLGVQLEGFSTDMEESESTPPSMLLKPFKDDPAKPLLETPTEADATQEVSDNATPGKPDTQDVVEDTDPELVDIFNDEAQELLAAIDASLCEWQRDPLLAAPKAELQRQLHTLKGGARMVGWREMAGIAHAFESDIIALKDAPLAQDFERWENQRVALEHFRTDKMRPVDLEENTADSPEHVEQVRALEVLKVSVDSLDQLANVGGELTIARSQLDEQRQALVQVINDLDQAQRRTMDQLRRLETQTQAQIAYRREQVDASNDEVFDPLEMDRYTQLQQLTNGLLESLSDIADLKTTANDVLRHMESTLQQQGRMNTTLVQGLHRARMIPVARILPRLRRLVDQIGRELDKSVAFYAEQVEGDLQREVLERVATSLEHLVRNALDHGIENLQERQKAGKPDMAKITLVVQQSDNELVFKLSDDGAGIDHDKVLAKALAEGMISAEDALSREDVNRLIMRPGFSTAADVSEISGRGVGLDVVESEILTLGGRVELHSEEGVGTEFSLAVPFTQSVNRALLVDVAGQRFALPFVGVEGIIRISRRELAAMREDTKSPLSYGNQHYRFCELSRLLGMDRATEELNGTFSPLILVRTADGNFAIRVDALRGSRDLVIKSLGPQFGKLLGIAGATIMGDGSVINILDLPPLLRAWQQGLRFAGNTQLAEDAQAQRAHILIVDDSITVRKITSRLLARHHYKVETAKDGVEGLEKLAQTIPDAIMLDVEMPRMDGFEFASQVRHSAVWRDIPIVMVSSRSGEKHRRRAEDVGVDLLLSKPYNEDILLAMLEKLIQQRHPAGDEYG